MEHFAIAALVRAENGSTDRHSRDSYRQDAMAARARRNAARRRALIAQRMRSVLADVLRRAAEAIEPPRCIDSSLATDHS